MKPHELKSVRRERGWSQQKLAVRLGLSQSYVAMMENGQRGFPDRLVRRLARVLHLPPTVLPPSGSLEKRRGQDVAQSLAEQLAALGYPGFAYLRPRRWKRNPAEVLLTALAQPELEARLVEALPWVLVSFPAMDTSWLVREAKQRDLQNRVGFVVGLARRGARNQSTEKVEALGKLEQLLAQSRLVKEDNLCKAAMSQVEKRWLKEHRSQEAVDWNLLTDLRAENLRHVS